MSGVPVVVPVGAIIPFAGEPTKEIENSGWLVCDGRDLRRDEYAELFMEIGTSFGAAAVDGYNLPDLRGFFVRCVDGDKNCDPDSADRIPLAVGGNSGKNVGTKQGYATASPTRGHEFTSAEIPASIKHTADGGCGTKVPRWNDGSVSVFPYTGGDRETRPDNRNVAYIIKYCANIGGSEVVPPVGGVLPFAGDDTTTHASWFYCKGDDTLSRAKYSLLFAAIGTANGTKDGCFTLPDYQNAFLRGVDMGSERDPDAMKRTPPPGGFDKDRVGSIQAYATALPKMQFNTPIYNLPASSGDKIVNGAIYTYRLYNSDSVSINLTQDGGDNETRPKNIGVNWIIRYDLISAPPVGSVVFAGIAMDKQVEGWHLCDGSSLSIDAYSDLFAAIDYTYGGSGGSFNIPDYRGYFLRGSGTKTIHRDNKDVLLTALGRVDDYWTARPINPFIGMAPNLPVSTIQGHGEIGDPWERENGTRVIKTCCGDDNSIPPGGDHETRPINVYLNAFIKVKNLVDPN